MSLPVGEIQGSGNVQKGWMSIISHVQPPGIDMGPGIPNQWKGHGPGIPITHQTTVKTFP